MLFRNKAAKRQRSSVVRIPVLLLIALKNLSSKRLRTLLTLGGIMIGVGATVFLVSLATGLHNVVNDRVIGSSSVKTIDVATPNSSSIPLSVNRVNKISDIAHVDKVAPVYIAPGKVSSRGSLTDAVLYGTDNTFIDLSGLKIIAGKSTLDAADSVIISKSLLSLIGQGDARSAIGQTINIQLDADTTSTSKTKTAPLNLKIIGITDIGNGTAVYMRATLLAKSGLAAYGQVKVVADNRANVPVIRQQIAGLGLTTTSPLDTLDEINTIFKVFTFVVIGFGGIGMIIAILGMFNTLTISLLERTSEIGLMITLGGRKADVQRLLTLEALMLSLLGSIGGIIGAWIFGLVVNGFLTYFAHGRGVTGSISAFSIEPSLVITVIIATMIIGGMVAIYPARRASKINPINALRFE